VLRFLRRIFASLGSKVQPKPRPEPTQGETFAAWFTRQGFRHFKPHEFEHFFERRLNDEPPRELWMNIVPTLRILDDLREVLGAPITLNSTYRALPYNRSIGSSDGSQHVRFRAVDFKAAGYTPHEVFQILIQWRNAGKFVGGLGLYASFVHIDTRSNNSTWP